MSVVYYWSGWKKPYIYHSVKGEWSTTAMNPTHKHHWFCFYLTESPSDFVLTDGKGSWDNPQNGKQNYTIPKEGRYAVYKGELLEIQDNYKPLLLITDIDGTLLENNRWGRQALKRFTHYWIITHLFNGSKLVYNTGRSLGEFLSLFSGDYDILDPDLIVTSVGSDVYSIDTKSKEYVPHSRYYDMFDKNHWDSGILAAVLKENFNWLRFPDKQFVFPFKVWVTASSNDVWWNFKGMKEYLKNKDDKEHNGKVLRVRCILSGAGNNRYIDFTPHKGGKSMGVLYAQRIFGFDVNRTLVAGDSGNDITMFKGTEHGVITGNAQSELLDWFHMKKRTHKYVSHCYYADAIIEASEKLIR